jgi:hypothetical protein
MPSEWARLGCFEGSPKIDSQGVEDCKKTNEGRYPFVGSKNPAPLYSQASLYIMDVCYIITGMPVGIAIPVRQLPSFSARSADRLLLPPAVEQLGLHPSQQPTMGTGPL